jgi:polyphenol oxidase
MWPIRQTAIGRVVVPPHVPDGFSLFYTTVDFPGRITPELLALAGVPLANCNQVHGATVVKAPREDRWRECDSCDALWTDERGKALAIKVADCLPVTLVDPETHVIANIHSGWRGAVQNIVAKTIDAVPIRSGLAYLGPSIRVCCFEVGEEVAEQFPPQHVDRTRAKPHVDLVAYTKDLLGGFDVIDSELCTRCDGSIFHSYRRDRSGGRNLAIVAQ